MKKNADWNAAQTGSAAVDDHEHFNCSGAEDSPSPPWPAALIYGVYCVPRSPSASFFNMKYINFVDEFKSSALLKG
ncbi:hypothetical protein [Serratia oryzae]|uniref:hypothetical protein n=1 Tax=Serratia oryzae TaxID=2034155 RepID=UPI0012E10A84|nr:hypothetical protein [Serratia oryzae]